MRIIFWILTVGLWIGGVVVSAALLPLAIFTLASGIILHSLRRVESDPPSIAVVTKFGNRLWKIGIDDKGNKILVPVIKKEGWRLFWFYPYLYGFIEIDVSKKNPDFKSQKVMTPDKVEIEIPLSITYVPDSDNIINFLNSGKESGVEDILQDIVQQKLREWAIATEEGPQTWEEAMAAKDDAIWLLSKAILGEELPTIVKDDKTPSEVPSVFWRQYFYTSYFKGELEQKEDEKDRGYEKRKKEMGKWLKKIEEELKGADSKTSDEKKDRMKKQIEGRKNEVDEIRRGNGCKPIKHLGIILKRLNLGEFKLLGEVAKAAELKAKEEREALAENVEIDNFNRLVKKVIKETGVSSKEAIRVVQSERKKLIRKELIISGGSGSSGAQNAAITGAVLAEVMKEAEKKGGKKDE